MKYYVSIHDVSPNNLSKIKNIIKLLKTKYDINKLCLLVIPGLKWEEKYVKQLISWQNSGFEIAAHGWYHKSGKKQSLFHILHGLIMSGNCAEHLSKNRDELIDLLKNSYNWFVNNNFLTPTLYVPPAWALGNLNIKEDLSHLPFQNYECTTGLYLDGKYRFIPLVGFEAATYFKAFFQRFFNFINYQMAKFTGVLRIAIHPRDFQLHLVTSADNYLSKATETIFLHELS